MVRLSGAAAPRGAAHAGRAVQAGVDAPLDREAHLAERVVSRRTVARRVALSGVGLHMGVPVQLAFEPAEAGSGIRFRRVDRGGAETPARVEHAVLAERRTQL